ncbi:hypothetical protein CR194_17950 [Salipaludibacillus keqinensis]|uniref:Uncharacterized protein n=1 Tax=Salipaludibacillus keqinensis TaxID=2045207 RepID=A0A323TAX8_9BACI|nr:hypothetical protein [Salipaludibacillus keqinensis]PYZ92076.1 hypothetical protein CR194_17950 [Salipaludibacillus keqinensis]
MAEKDIYDQLEKMNITTGIHHDRISHIRRGGSKVTIEIKEVMADVVIKVGDRMHTFKKDQYGIRAHLDKNESLILI